MLFKYLLKLKIQQQKKTLSMAFKQHQYQRMQVFCSGEMYLCSQYHLVIPIYIASFSTEQESEHRLLKFFASILSHHSSVLTRNIQRKQFWGMSYSQKRTKGETRRKKERKGEI